MTWFVTHQLEKKQNQNNKEKEGIMGMIHLIQDDDTLLYC